jgi:hemerythrin superfamily protein
LPIEPADKAKKVTFDPTINLGHILTFIGFLVSGFIAYATIDKRLTVVEEARKFQQQVDAAQDARATAASDQLTSVIVRLERQVERLNDKLDRK